MDLANSFQHSCILIVDYYRTLRESMLQTKMYDNPRLLDLFMRKLKDTSPCVSASSSKMAQIKDAKQGFYH